MDVGTFTNGMCGKSKINKLRRLWSWFFHHVVSLVLFGITSCKANTTHIFDVVETPIEFYSKQPCLGLGLGCTIGRSPGDQTEQ